jgi:hypothetical protein
MNTRQNWSGHEYTLMLFDHSDMQQLLGEEIRIEKGNARGIKNLKDRFKRRFDPDHPSITMKSSKAASTAEEWSQHSQLLALVTCGERQQLLGEETRKLSTTQESYLNFRFKHLIPPSHPSVEKKRTGSVSVGPYEFSAEVSLDPSRLESDNDSEFHTPLNESPSPFYFTPVCPESQDRVSPSVNARKVLTFSDDVDEDMPTTTTTTTTTADDDETDETMEEEDDDDKTDETMESPYFTDKEIVSLLGMFVPANVDIPIEELLDNKWLKEKEKDSDQLRVTFDKWFGHLTPSACALLRSNIEVEVPEGMVTIKSVVKPYVAERRRKVEELRMEIGVAQNKGRASTVYKTKFREEQMGEKMTIIKRISFLLGKSATELAHDGTSTYAEPTQAGVIRVAEELGKLMGPNRKDQTLIDCGSGVGTALWVMCQVLDCKGIGLEYSTNRVYTGSAKTRQLLDELEGNSAFQFRVANMDGDLHDLESLFEGVVAAYQYDEAFSPNLMVDTLKMYKNAPLTFRFVVCAKSQRYPAYGKQMYADYGLYPLTLPISTKKVGSGECSSFVIFGRRCCDYSDLSVLEPPKTTTGYPMPKKDCKPTPLPAEATRILDGDMEAAKQHYKTLESKMHALMSMKRSRKHKQDVSCMCSAQYEHCQDKSCQDCKSAFEHTDVRELYAQPVPWLYGQTGLFTGKELGIDRYVIEYTGKQSQRRLEGNYVLEVSAGTFVDAEGRGLQQYINHSCDPNCIFQKWDDSRGRLRISIATQRLIKKDEELTVDYGSAREDFACECPACTGFTKTILLLGMTGISEAHIQRRLNIQKPLDVDNMCKAMLKMGSKIDQKLRDNLRLLALQTKGWRPYTISMENLDHGEGANSHFTCDWNRPTLVKRLKEMRIIVDTIELDNYWMPSAYSLDKAKPAFYKETLPSLGKFVRVGGSILLPAQVYMLDGLLSNRTSWEPFFDLHLLGATEREKQSPLSAGMKVLEEAVGEGNVHAALGKDCANNKAYTNITLETLQAASSEGQQLCKNQGLPVCLLKLERKAKPIPSPSHGTKTSKTICSRRKRPSSEVVHKQASKTTRSRTSAPLKAMLTLSSIQKSFECEGIVILPARGPWSLSISQTNQLREWATSYLTRSLATIRGRDLTSSLENGGFDVIRLRGKGRYDMVPPACELEKDVGFLQDTEAPWMPVIHKLLGSSACLIHRGFFALYPAGATQEYHQDGPPAATRYAVNVFVPLIDMRSELGPTEFVKGSHVLGMEDYNKNRTDAPILKAGQPLVFDYRLGHRGLENKHTSVIRFMYYCTYSASKKNGKPIFEDTVNFGSNNRLGDLVPLPKSRAERYAARQSRDGQAPDAGEGVQDSSCALLRKSPRTSLKVSNRQRL